MEKIKLSVIIPMYNEHYNVKACAAALLSEAEHHDRYDTHIYFVNDGSTDDCYEIAKNIAFGEPTVSAIGYAENHGKGYAVRHGMLNSEGDIKVFTDCDLAYGSEAVYRIADKMLNDKTDICIGSRAIAKDGYSGYTFARKVMSKAYIKLVCTVAGFSYSDSQCGIKAFSASAAEKIFSKCTVDRFAFDLEALMLADKFKLKVSELGVKIIHHNEKSSKVNPIKDIFEMLGDVKHIKKEIADIHE